MFRKTLDIGRLMNAFVNHELKKKSQGKQKIEQNDNNTVDQVLWYIANQTLKGILGLKGLYQKLERNLQFKMLV